MTVLLDGLTWGEGPRSHRGSLWVSDTQGSRLWTDVSGAWVGHDLAGPSNGLWFLPDGTLVGAMMTEQRIGRWDGAGFAEHVDLSHLARGTLGDLVGNADGTLYVDDLGPRPTDGSPPRDGRILRVAPDGAASVAAASVDFPNGLALIDGGSTLVVAQTFAQSLLAFDVAADGALTDRRVYADIRALGGPDARPDGIWPAADGIWVATLGAGVVLRVRDGELLESVPVPGFPIACCEDDGGRLVVTVASTDGREIFEALAAKAVTAVVLGLPR